ncbi:universal stress protein [Egicoccus sp. AB-alg6-2]|uniref:universal stress protein n=1 Tax=Egicoccus sp. AB-alg6-2 TaxID=3242692 RepID=UPI00359E351C
MDTIVVGVDGSERSTAALRWAVEEARLRNAQVEAVYVLDMPGMMASGYTDGLVNPDVLDNAIVGAREEAQRALDEAIADVEAGEVTIRRLVVDDRGPADALVERSRDAALLVVGSRGLSGFRELVLGSVSRQAANHAHCPVVIIRYEAESTDEHS